MNLVCVCRIKLDWYSNTKHFYCFLACAFCFEVLSVHLIDRYQNAVLRSDSAPCVENSSFSNFSREFTLYDIIVYIGLLKMLCKSILSLSGGVESEWNWCSSPLRVEKGLAFVCKSSCIVLKVKLLITTQHFEMTKYLRLNSINIIG